MAPIIDIATVLCVLFEMSFFKVRDVKHLKNMNQPIVEHESDDDSLGSGELFDAPKGPPPAKWLLAAAIKAR